MIKTKQVSCPMCGEHRLRLKESQNEVEIDGAKVNVPFRSHECDSCGSNLALDDDLRLNARAMRQATKARINEEKMNHIPGIMSPIPINAFNVAYGPTKQSSDGTLRAALAEVESLRAYFANNRGVTLTDYDKRYGKSNTGL